MTVDETGVDETVVDETGADKLGINQKNYINIKHGSAKLVESFATAICHP